MCVVYTDFTFFLGRSAGRKWGQRQILKCFRIRILGYYYITMLQYPTNALLQHPPPLLIFIITAHFFMTILYVMLLTHSYVQSNI